MKYRELPTVERLKALFEYSPDTGIVLRKKTGRAVGCVLDTGHMIVGIDGKMFGLHRVIWKMMIGNDPMDHQIDHIDGDGLNNRWSNLRAASHAENARNSRFSRRNSSGVKGICWEKRVGKWRAGIGSEGRFLFLGHFNDLEVAAAVVRAARIQHHGKFANDGTGVLV
jgi:hypothetical protein